MEEIILVGFGGHARSVADSIERANQYKIAGYVDWKQCETEYPYLGKDNNLEYCYRTGIRNATVSIGYLGKSDLRERLYAYLKELGFRLPVITDPSAVVSDSAIIGEGTFIGKSSIVNAQARIGKMCIINTMALIEHECIVEDFVHVAVHGVLCGNVHIGKRSFIGANATIIQGMELPEKAFVPAGGVIRRKRENG